MIRVCFFQRGLEELPEELPARRGVRGSLQIPVHHQGAAAVATKYIFNVFSSDLCFSIYILMVLQRATDECWDACIDRGQDGDTCYWQCNKKVTNETFLFTFKKGPLCRRFPIWWWMLLQKDVELSVTLMPLLGNNRHSFFYLLSKSCYTHLRFSM